MHQIQSAPRPYWGAHKFDLGKGKGRGGKGKRREGKERGRGREKGRKELSLKCWGSVSHTYWGLNATAWIYACSKQKRQKDKTRTTRAKLSV